MVSRIAGCLATVDHQIEIVELAMGEPEATTAQARAGGFYHRQRGANGHCRIKGIASRLQNLHAGFGGQRVGAGHGVSRWFQRQLRLCRNNETKRQQQGRPDRESHSSISMILRFRLAGEPLVFLQQLFRCLRIGRIQGNAVDRAYSLALRFVKVTDTLGAQRRVDFVNLQALIDGGIRTDRLAHIAIDAFFRDLQRHNELR